MADPDIARALEHVDPALRAGLRWPIRALAGRAMSARRLRKLRVAECIAGWFLGRSAPSLWIAGYRDAALVRVFVFDPRATRDGAPAPAVVHLHGGGFISGTPRTAAPILRRLAQELRCVIVSVDYRLAPETPFPGALEDNYAALHWLNTHARALNIDPARIAVLGESAGGGHAAALAIAVRERGEYALAMQVLCCPMLDDRTGSLIAPSAPHVGVFVWNASANRFGWTALLGQAAGVGTPPHGAVPARVADLAGLAPAWIGVGTVDLFHDEDVAYAQRLHAAGVPVTLLTVPGAYHGFEFLAKDTAPALAYKHAWKSALGAVLHRPASSPPAD